MATSIGLTQKKLREAQFFLILLKETGVEVLPNNPEAFGFYLSAFLSASRAVTWALQYEEKSKYDAWSQPWFQNRTPADRALLDVLKEQRNVVQHRGGADISAAWEYIPFTEVRSDKVIFEWCAPPGTPQPQVGHHVYRFEGSPESAVSQCEHYLAVLSDLVHDFIRDHPS